MGANNSDAIKKSTAFDWVFKGLIGVVCWLVADMHSDLKMVLQVIPAIQVEVENLKDKSLMERFRRFENMPPAKHEDIITFDSLNQK